MLSTTTVIPHKADYLRHLVFYNAWNRRQNAAHGLAYHYATSGITQSAQNTLINSIKAILIYTAIILFASIVYFVYAYTTYPPTPERETFLSEIGEGFGEAGLWALSFIYARTLLKLVMGKGALAKRLLPEYSFPVAAPIFQQLLGF